MSSLLGVVAELKKWTVSLVDRFVLATGEDNGGTKQAVGSSGGNGGGVLLRRGGCHGSPRCPRRKRSASLPTYSACTAMSNVFAAAAAAVDVEWSNATPSVFSMPFELHPSSGVDGTFVGFRFVAYYEVRIAPTEAYVALPAAPLDGDGYMDMNNGVGVPTDCVAVGLATKAFMRHKRMPGWDAESYGYHGDDGAIFHGRGRQLSKYGPSFGLGDVVGRGIDYSDSTVFFTLNGVSLGTAFHLRPRANATELCPTVGVDAAVCVTLNYGREPFVFDLLQHISKRETQLGLEA